MSFVSRTYMISDRVPGAENSNQVGKVRYLSRKNLPQENFSADAKGFEVFDQATWTDQVLTDLETRLLDGRPQLAGYIHGFDTAYDPAFSDLQTFGRGLVAAGFPGVMVGVTWPSFTHSTIFPLESSYGRAQKNARKSFTVLAALLELVDAAQQRYSNLDASILCHSMGNYLLAEGARRVSAPRRPLKSIVMLAADVDNGLFNPGDRRGPRVTGLTDQVAVYYSRNDDVLYASGIINDDVRLGFSGPADYSTLIDKVIGIDCTDQVATGPVAQTYVPGGLSNVLGDVVVHSCYRYVPSLHQDETQEMLGLETPHREPANDTPKRFEFIRFPAI